MSLPVSTSSSAQQPKEDVTTTSLTEKARDGYPSLAWLMHLYPDNAIFRRFGELNMLHLLRLQAELQDMENELQKIREEDTMSDDLIRMCHAKDFRAMRDNEEDSEQYELLISIGKKLQEYNAALALSLQSKGADQPTKRELRNLQEWLSRPKGGNGFLAGEEARVWEGRDTSEYVTLFPRDLEDDAFTSFLGGRLLDIYHAVLGHRQRSKYGTDSPDVDIRKYSGRRIRKASNIAVALMSSILPTLAILVLYFVRRMIVRIGLVILFTAVFSIALAVFTAARKVEIFSATAAFAAVEVVYIGGTTNSTS
ncbi:uncharacterized protein K460DRAFT_416351 [Cucurbitaria berberidis CBS 394.84]|uniref:DUF6594 domain-containing protein n=1 Tax=Cucurbitaria berberidis CBS 394.84 TaxID=1168544 RepID=A0A9P4GH19_9PLEO|nr:uncharacterized protein K460DRAFT_416351 [Cucurbitaria berberidis CBS 394.84]KAF1845020.1 hypothetical protein K460DRAFT_416351 [Cucurbitaria berberidis CBS 394.84]